MFHFCKACGKKETNKRALNIDNVCSECETKIPSVNIENLTENDDNIKLSEASLGDFKSWIDGTIRLTIQTEMKTYSEMLNEEVGKLKTELNTTKIELKDGKNDIQNIKLENVELSKNLNDLKETTDNNIKYLLNMDRNNRRRNAIFFGIPEEEKLQIGEGENRIELSNDIDKISFMIDFMGGDKHQVANVYRLGKKGDKIRPIKTTFLSDIAAKYILTNSNKLANLKLNIYVKQDRSKGEMEEFKRLGKRKEQLIQEYPSTDETTHALSLRMVSYL